MARRPARAHKHEHDTDDAFIARILELSHWVETHRQILFVVGAILVVMAGAGLYYHNYRKSLVAEAAQSMEQIHQSLSLQDRGGAKNQLVTFLQRFDGTPYAGEARMLLGQIYLENNQPQQAQAVLEPIAESPSRPIELQAAALLGAAYEQEKRWDDAVQVYMRIADRSKLDFEVRQALDNAARIKAQQGDSSGAAQLYQRILASLGPDDPSRGLYQMRIQEMDTKAVNAKSSDG